MLMPADQNRRNSYFYLMEDLFFIIAIIWSTRAILSFIAYGAVKIDTKVDDQAAIVRVAMIIVFGMLLPLMAYNFQGVYRELRANPAVVVLVGICITSTLWSSDPALTLQRSIIFGGTTMIGVYFGSRYSARSILQLLGAALGICAVVSLFLVLALPTYGEMQTTHPGAWQGAFTHKNILGRIGVLSVLVFAFLGMDQHTQHQRIWLGLSMISVVLIIGTTSATAYMASIILLGFYAIHRVFLLQNRNLPIFLVGGLIIASIAAMAGVAYFADILNVFGRDTTFTGRVPIWNYGVRSFMHKPFLGYGYNAFFVDASTYGGAKLRLLTGFSAAHMHNSWLQLVLSIGLAGLTAFLFIFIGLARNSLLLARVTGEKIYIFILMFVAFLSIFSLVETVFLSYKGLFHLILIAFCVSVGREARAHEMMARPRAANWVSTQKRA
jgi:O-antigen ligase